MFSNVDSTSVRTKCHTAGENSGNRPQAASAECWFLPSERTRRHAERANENKQKTIIVSLVWYNIEIRSINSISRAVSQHLSERRDIPRAKAEGRHRRRRAQNAGFYRASALVGMSNGQLRINKQNEMICAIFE